MSAASVTAYLSPTMARKRAINSGESGGAEGWTMFILVSCSYSFPRYRGAAQPVVDRLSEPVMRHRHHRDAARALGVEGAKIAEKIGGGLGKIGAGGQIHDRGRAVCPRPRGGTECQQRLAGFNAPGVEPHFGARRVMRGQHARRQRLAGVMVGILRRLR